MTHKNDLFKVIPPKPETYTSHRDAATASIMIKNHSPFLTISVKLEKKLKINATPRLNKPNVFDVIETIASRPIVTMPTKRLPIVRPTLWTKLQTLEVMPEKPCWIPWPTFCRKSPMESVKSIPWCQRLDRKLATLEAIRTGRRNRNEPKNVVDWCCLAKKKS